MPRPRDAIQQRAPIGQPRVCPLRLQFHYAAFDEFIVQAATAAQRAIKIQVGVLTDAGAVVHQADHAHARMVGNRVEQRQHIVCRHLAAQMQEVLGFQQIGIGQRVEIDHAVAKCADALLVETQIAKTQRIEHRGHAGAGALRIVRHHGGA